jgi:hypothetical protein
MYGHSIADWGPLKSFAIYVIIQIAHRKGAQTMPKQAASDSSSEGEDNRSQSSSHTSISSDSVIVLLLYM